MKSLILGPGWRAVGRLKRDQIVGRMRMRSRQAIVRISGIDRVLPRQRQTLAYDWEQRILGSALARLSESTNVWSEVAGLRFRSNAHWLATGAGRALRYERDLSRLELHYHEFIGHAQLDGRDAWDFVDSYLESHRNRVADSRCEWHPYAVSNRLVSWLAMLARSSEDAPAGTRQRLACECLLLTDFLSWMLERDIEANHLLKNLFGIALSDIFLSPDRERIELSVTLYLEELERQMLSDGGHYELSPMYHAKVMQDASLLAASLPLGQEDTGERLRQAIGKGKTWLRSMLVAPGRWANVNDSWWIPALADQLLGEGAFTTERRLEALESSGFVNGSLGGWRWLFDVGGVGPCFNPGHSHSDALSLVIYRGGTPIVVDPGVLHYSPNDERRFLKSCHAHNGPCLRDRDHTELLGSFRVGRAAQARLGEFRDEGQRQVATGAHDGYGTVELARRVAVEGECIDVVDTWSPRGKRRFAPWSRFLWNGELGAVKDCSIENDSISLRFEPAGGDRLIDVEIRVIGALKPRLAVQESWYSDQFGRASPAFETIVTGDGCRDALKVVTQMRRLALRRGTEAATERRAVGF